jgi:hypothetical protein
MDLDWQTVTTGISVLISLVVLGLGVYTFYIQRKDKRPRLKVTVREDTATTTKMQGTFLLGVGVKRNEDGKPDGAGEPVVCLELANLGEKTVRVVEVKMVQSSGAYMRLENMGAERPFPPVIEPGDSTRCWISLGKITDTVWVGGGRGKIRLTFEVKDSLGQMHRDKIDIDTDEWAPYSTLFSERAG